MVSKSLAPVGKASARLGGRLLASVAAVAVGLVACSRSDEAIEYNPLEGPRLVQAVDAGDYASAKRYVTEGDDVNQEFPKGIPLIFGAIGLWNQENIDFQVEMQKPTGMTENLMILKLLLEAGAPADTAMSNGVTPLHYAASNGNFGYMFLLLLHGADPDHKNDQGYSPRCNVSKALKAEALKLIEMFDNNPVDCPSVKFGTRG